MKDVETTKISVTSSLTINLGNYNSGRVEMSIEKTINNPENVDIEKVKEEAWNEVNSEVDKQIADLKASISK